MSVAYGVSTTRLRRMSDRVPPSPFRCPNCKASYQVVKVAAAQVLCEAQLTCLSCGGPLNEREGRYVLKYFFTDRAGKKIPLSSRRNARKSH